MEEESTQIILTSDSFKPEEIDAINRIIKGNSDGGRQSISDIRKRQVAREVPNVMEEIQIIISLIDDIRKKIIKKVIIGKTGKKEFHRFQMKIDPKIPCMEFIFEADSSAWAVLTNGLCRSKTATKKRLLLAQEGFDRRINRSEGIVDYNDQHYLKIAVLLKELREALMKMVGRSL